MISQQLPVGVALTSLALHFDGVGFFLPAAISSLFLFRAIRDVSFRMICFIVVCGILTFLSATTYQQDKASWIRLAPFSLFPLVFNMLCLIVQNSIEYGVLVYKKGNKCEDQLLTHLLSNKEPFGPLCFWAFASVAIPDTICTYQLRGNWVVGAKGWVDLLVIFPWIVCLFLYIGSAMTLDAVNRRNFLYQEFSYHFSPWVCESSDKTKKL